MFSRRTAVLLLIAVAATIAMAWVWHQRQARCAETRHSFSRRAPIAGASGRNTFMCQAMYEEMPLTDKVIAAVWLFAALAFLRSVAIDVQLQRTRARELLE